MKPLSSQRLFFVWQHPPGAFGILDRRLRLEIALGLARHFLEQNRSPSPHDIARARVGSDWRIQPPKVSECRTVAGAGNAWGRLLRHLLPEDASGIALEDAEISDWLSHLERLLQDETARCQLAIPVGESLPKLPVATLRQRLEYFRWMLPHIRPRWLQYPWIGLALLLTASVAAWVSLSFVPRSNSALTRVTLPPAIVSHPTSPQKFVFDPKLKSPSPQSATPPSPPSPPPKPAPPAPAKTSFLPAVAKNKLIPAPPATKPTTPTPVVAAEPLPPMPRFGGASSKPDSPPQAPSLASISADPPAQTANSGASWVRTSGSSACIRLQGKYPAVILMLRLPDSPSLYLGQYEVTIEQWLAVTGKPARSAGDSSNPRLPVSGVSWEDAQRFADLLKKQLGGQVQGVRLPSVGEWARAAEICWAAAGGRPPSNENVGQALYNPKLIPVSESPSDESFQQLFGNTVEWTQDIVTDGDPSLAVRKHTLCGGAAIDQISMITPRMTRSVNDSRLSDFRYGKLTGLRILVEEHPKAR